MDTSATYGLTFDEYHSGARLARIRLTGTSAIAAHRALAKSGFTVLFVLALFMLACYIYFGIHFDRGQGITFAIAAITLGLFYLPFMERQSDRRFYKDGRWSEPVTLTLRNDHISLTLPDAVEVRIPWGSFSSVESETMIVLLTPTKMIYLPKCHFPEDALNFVRAVVPLSKGKLAC